MLNSGCYTVAPTGLLDNGESDGAFKLHKGAASQAIPRETLVQDLIKLCSK
jgi:hypothetical protein